MFPALNHAALATFASVPLAREKRHPWKLARAFGGACFCRVWNLSEEARLSSGGRLPCGQASDSLPGLLLVCFIHCLGFSNDQLRSVGFVAPQRWRI